MGVCGFSKPVKVAVAYLSDVDDDCGGRPARNVCDIVAAGGCSHCLPIPDYLTIISAPGKGAVYVSLTVVSPST